MTLAPQSVDDLVSMGSPPSSLPHIAPADSKSESMNPVGWPAPGRAEKQARQQPNVSAHAAPPSVWGVVYSKRLLLLANIWQHCYGEIPKAPEISPDKCSKRQQRPHNPEGGEPTRNNEAYASKLWRRRPLRRLMQSIAGLRV